MHTSLQTLAARYGLNVAQTRRLWQLGGLHERPPGLGDAVQRALVVLAALLLGAGLIFWVAANWQTYTRGFKLHVLQAAVLLPALGALALPRVRTAGLLLATLALGGLLAFVGQTYQTGANAWQLFATWAALALPWALVARRDGLWAVWALIAGVALALRQAQDLSMGPLALGMPFMTLRGTALHALPWLAYALWPLWLPHLPALGLRQRARWSWRVGMTLALGAWCALGLSALWVGTYASWLDSEATRGLSGWPPYALCLALVAAGVWQVRRMRAPDMPLLGVATLALNALVMGALVRWLIPRSGDLVAGAFLLSLAAAACLGTSLVWLHRVARQQGAEAGDASDASDASDAAAGERQARVCALIDQARAQGLLPDDAAQHWRQTRGERTSWVLQVLGFVAAQWVMLPFLTFLVVWLNDWALRPPGLYLLAAIFLGLGVWGLRRSAAGVFASLMAFTALLTGLAFLVWHWGSGLWEGDNAVLLAGLAVLVALVAAVRQRWAQVALGVLATPLALAVGARSDWWGGWVDAALGRHALMSWPHAFNASVLALLWAVVTVAESRGAADGPALWRVVQPRLHAALQGVACALLLAVGAGMGVHFMAATGSAEVEGAGTQWLWALDARSLWQMALALGAALWLGWHWQLRQSGDSRSLGRLAMVLGVLLVAALVLPNAGVVALLGLVAAGTGRRALAALALGVMLAGLGAFYYALAWPLVDKAALLAVTGMALALALLALQARHRRGLASPVEAVPRGPWLAWALTLGGVALALGLVRADVAGKEQIIAHGRKLYVALAPVDPRSLMQGDYMALNFAVPDAVRDALDRQPATDARVVAAVDARGVANMQRLHAAGQPLAANEALLPLRRKEGRWMLVSDAFYFPEGQGRSLEAARFGELRALPDARALLVGLADEQLRPLPHGLASAPSPRNP